MTDLAAGLSAWKAVDLITMQKSLDTRAVELLNTQKDNVVSRKALADQTREFRRLPDEHKVPAFKTLLKAYQGEIDTLTRSAKTAESYFLGVYKQLAEVPDPAVLLEAAMEQSSRAAEAQNGVQRAAALQDENAALRASLAEAQAAAAERNKYAQSLARLEAKFDESLRGLLANKEAELHAQYDEKLHNYEDREQDLSRRVVFLKAQLTELKSSHNAAAQARIPDDAPSASASAELDLLTQDLTQANARVAELESRNVKLRAEVEAVRQGRESHEHVRSLEAQLADLQAEAVRLMQALDAHKASSDADLAAARRTCDALGADLDAARAENGLLREKLDALSDYDEVKRELDILKYVEFSALVDLPQPNSTEINVNGSAEAPSLETLLTTKNRRLEDELAGLRASLADATQQLQGAQAHSHELRQKTHALEQLNAALENDLSRLHKGAPAASAPESALAAAPESTPATTSARDDAGILNIITQQRDRFRARTAELQEQLALQADSMDALRTELKALQADNVKLYEKSRYLQTYRDAEHIDMYPPATEDPYRSKYEDSINPFEAFRTRERGLAAQRLNVVDKLVLSLTSLVMQSRTTRLVILVYLGVLHVLAFTGVV